MPTGKKLFIVAVVFLLAGCFGNPAPPLAMKYYTLEYSLPRPESGQAANVLIRIEPFTAAPDYSGKDMVYRSESFMRDAYPRHRWNTAPVNMVQNLLLRDMRQEGFCSAVAAPEESGAARYILHGQIEEFLEIDNQAGSAASLIVFITLTDTTHTGPIEKIRLQKMYHIVEPFGAPKQPNEYARSMSAAMKKFSDALRIDLCSVIMK